jgi:hypothetical protein
MAVSGNVNRFPHPEHLNLREPGEPLNLFPQLAQETIIAAVPPPQSESWQTAEATAKSTVRQPPTGLVSEDAHEGARPIG